jgi:DNA polymerase-3 subunit beta
MMYMIDFTINKEELKAAVSNTKGLTGSKSLPILENFLIIANDNGTIQLVANNLETGVMVNMIGIVMSPGKVCIPSTIFQETLTKMPYDGMVHIVEENGTIQISCEKAKANIASNANAEDFPLPSKVEEEQQSFVIKSKEFKQLMMKCIFSASQDETRPILTGVNFIVKDKRLTCATTDSYRISKIWTNIEQKDISANFTVNAKNLLLLLKVLEDEDITVKVGKNNISFETERINFFSRLLDGKFIDYDKVFDGIEQKGSLKVNTKLLNNAVNFAGIIGKDKKVPVVFDISSRFLIYSTAENQNVEQEIEEYSYSGEDIKLGINAAFLLEAFKIIEDEEIEIGFTSSNHPIIINGINYGYLILPIRLKS